MLRRRTAMNFSSKFNNLARHAASCMEFFANKELYLDLQEACDYSLFSPGKRFRAVLSLATAELLELEAKKVSAFLVAIESIHIASLIHDDLPALDNDALRRGRASCHIVHGEGMALLAGDTLIGEAFALISQAKDLEAEEKVSLISLVAKTFIALCEGQAIDLSCAEKKDKNLLEKCHLKKTASLIEAAVIGPALLSTIKDDRKKIALLSEFSRNLGLLFQITDDILDVTSYTEKLGKKVGSDLEQAKQTYVSAYGLEGAKELACKHYERARSALEKVGGEIDFLMQIAESVLKREK